MQIENLPAYVTASYFTGVTTLALWRGDAEHRVTAATQQALVVGCLLGLFSWRGNVFDIVTFILACAVVVRGRGYWTVWACAAALLTLVADGIALAAPQVGLWAVASAQLLWSYLLATALLWGVVAKIRTEGQARSRQRYWTRHEA